MWRSLRRVPGLSSKRVLLITLFAVIFSLTSSILALIYQYKGYSHQQEIDMRRQQLGQIIDVQRELIGQLVLTRDRQLEGALQASPEAQCPIVMGSLLRSAPQVLGYIQRGLAVSFPPQIDAYSLREMQTRYASTVESIQDQYLGDICATLSQVDVSSAANERIEDLSQLVNLSEELEQLAHNFLQESQRALDSVYKESRIAILIAFLLQFGILIIVNYFDIRGFKLGESNDAT